MADKGPAVTGGQWFASALAAVSGWGFRAGVHEHAGFVTRPDGLELFVLVLPPDMGRAIVRVTYPADVGMRDAPQVRVSIDRDPVKAWADITRRLIPAAELFHAKAQARKAAKDAAFDRRMATGVRLAKVWPVEVLPDGWMAFQPGTSHTVIRLSDDGGQVAALGLRDLTVEQVEAIGLLLYPGGD